MAPMQAGPLDEGFLAQQMELLGRKRLAFLAQLFARSSDEIQDELECAAAGDERDAVRRAAHRLAGSAGALGLSELVTHASFIETQSARMSREALAGAVARIASLRRRAIAHLDTRLVERATGAAALGIDNQGETVVAWDADSGEPVHNAIVWQDTRTDRLVRELGGEAGQDRFRAACGLPLMSYRITELTA